MQPEFSPLCVRLTVLQIAFERAGTFGVWAGRPSPDTAFGGIVLAGSAIHWAVDPDNIGRFHIFTDCSNHQQVKLQFSHRI
jgi:hypothetical protein